GAARWRRDAPRRAGDRARHPGRSSPDALADQGGARSHGEARRHDPRPALCRGPDLSGDRRHAEDHAVARVPAALARCRSSARTARRRDRIGGIVMNRVLVVDDDQAVCRAVAKALTRSGYEVRTAHDGPPALAMTVDWTPDAVLVDLNMPTSGLDLVVALRAKFGRGLFVAMLTGEDHEAI